MKLQVIRVTLTALALVSSFTVAPATVRADATDTIKRFVGSSTVAVVRIQTSKLDLKSVLKVVFDAAKASDPEPGDEKSRQDMLRGLAMFEKAGTDWIRAFNDAGGRDIYVLIDMTVFPEPSFVVVATHTPNAKADALFPLLQAAKVEPGQPRPRFNLSLNLPGEARVGPDNTVLVGPGTLVDRAMSNKEDRSADLRRAWRAVDEDATASAVFVPATYIRRAFNEVPFDLPKEIGGGTSLIISRGLTWAAASVETGQQVKGQLVVQSESPAAAKALRLLVAAALQTWKQEALKWGGPVPTTQVLQMLTPTQLGDQLQLKLSHSDAQALAKWGVQAAYRARQAARQAVSMSNIRQLCVAVHAYAVDHEGRFPTDLGSIKEYLGQPMLVVRAPQSQATPERAVEQLSDPKLRAWINKNASYAYIPIEGRMDNVKQPSETVLVFEKVHFARDGKVGVGFCDGHVEAMTVNELNKKLTKQTGFTAEQWSKVAGGQKPKAK